MSAVKKCPEGKMLNPKTNRCIAIKKDPAAKKCAEGKVLNPKTNRCVAVKNNKKVVKAPSPPVVIANKEPSPDKNAVRLLKYLKENKGAYETMILRSNAYDGHVITVDTEYQRAESGKQLRITRKRPGEMFEVLTLFKYNGREEDVFKNVQLNDLIKKQKQNYMRNFLKELSSMRNGNGY